MEKFEKLYYDPKHPGAYSGLYSFAKNLGKKVSKQKLKEWLMEQDSYTLHRPLRKKFPRNKTIVYGIDDTWQADLIDIQKLSSHNKGIKYLLCVIDVFSKFAWVIPLKNKTNQSIIEAFSKIFEERKPNKIHTDQGQEFLGKECQKFLKKHGVNFYFLNSEMKASTVERFNRTIKEKMWRYFTKSDEYKYIDILNDLVDNYNNSYHRSIKMKPIDVNAKNEQNVFENLYGSDRSLNNVSLKFEVGDRVRISKNKWLFEKSYTPNWTNEIFTISHVIIHPIPVYKIKDYSGEQIEGVFYDWELQKVVKKDDVYKIEEILKTRKTKNGTEYFVKWLGYPSKFNSWVKSSELE